MLNLNSIPFFISQTHGATPWFYVKNNAWNKEIPYYYYQLLSTKQLYINFVDYSLCSYSFK